MAKFSAPSPSTSTSSSETFRGSPSPPPRSPGRMFTVPSATPSLSPSSDSSRYGLAVRTSPRGRKRVRFATTAHSGMEVGSDARSGPPTTRGRASNERNRSPNRPLRSPPLIESPEYGSLGEEEVDTLEHMVPDEASPGRADLGFDLEQPIIVDEKPSPEQQSLETSVVADSHMAASGPLLPSSRTMDRIRVLLDHPNIASFKDNHELTNETPAHLKDSGTLEALIRSRRLVRQLPTNQNTGALPEPLIWRTLISLLRAAHYLHTGGRSSSEERGSPEWQPIVHNFINPINISYQHSEDEENGGMKASRKTPMLGIFTRCVVLPYIADLEDQDEDEQAASKEAFQQVLALRTDTGFEAPELLGSINDIPGPASDLWSIGAVMVAMMTGRTVWDLVVEEEFVKQSERRWMRRGSLFESWQDVDVDQRLDALMTLGSGTLTLALPDCYGESLRVLVECLLVFNPIERGTALEVLQDAEPMYRIRKLELEKAALAKESAESRYPTYYI